MMSFSLVKYSSSVINKSQHSALITLCNLQHQSHKKVSNFYKDFCSPSYTLTFVMTDWVKKTKNRNIANGQIPKMNKQKYTFCMFKIRISMYLFSLHYNIHQIVGYHFYLLKRDIVLND